MNSARAALVTVAVRRYHVGRVAALEMICRTPEYEAARQADRALDLSMQITAAFARFADSMEGVRGAVLRASTAFEAFGKAVP